MHNSQMIPIADAFMTTPFPLIADAVLRAKTDPEINEQLAGLIKTHGAASDIVKPLAALKAVKDNEAREELIRLLTESGEKNLPLLTMGQDHFCFLAAKSDTNSRGVGDWKRRRVVEMATEGLITDADIEREVFVKDIALDQLTAKLIKNGKLVRDGDGYTVPK